MVSLVASIASRQCWQQLLQRTSPAYSIGFFLVVLELLVGRLWPLPFVWLCGILTTRGHEASTLILDARVERDAHVIREVDHFECLRRLGSIRYPGSYVVAHLRRPAPTKYWQ